MSVYKNGNIFLVPYAFLEGDNATMWCYVFQRQDSGRHKLVEVSKRSVGSHGLHKAGELGTDFEVVAESGGVNPSRPEWAEIYLTEIN